MMKKLSSIRILLLAGLTALLSSCAPTEQAGAPVPEPTPLPAIAAPTEEPESYRLAAATPTPEPAKVHESADIGLCLSEVSLSGCFTARQLYGLESDWIELYNGSDRTLDLADFSLSDREEKPFKLLLDKQTVLPGAYVLIDLKDAPFKLKPGETVYLTDVNTYRYDHIVLPETADYTCGRTAARETVLFRYATPGKPNPAGYASAAQIPDFDAADVYISEILATGADEWIELKNGGSAPIVLDGWHLSLHKDKPDEIPLSGTVAPGAFLVIDGLTLPSAGCTVFLTDRDGFLRDTFETGVLPTGLSSGRDARTGQRLFYQTPTKGAENAESGYAGYAGDVCFSENTLYCAAPFTLTLTARDAEIWYTLDGTPPEDNGVLYTGPIPVSASTVVRAYAKKEGYLDSPETIRHFLFIEEHSVPVICIGMDQNDFQKVYKVKERQQIVEKPCSVTYYFADGHFGTSMRAAVKAKGRGSLKFAQKSLTFKLRNRFGTTYTDFPLFGPGVNEGIRYRAFCLRSGSQDYNRSIIRDTVVNRAAAATALNAVKTQPVAVYVNGEYLGLYMLQEEMNADYYVSHYGIDKDQLDVINQNAGVRSGTLDGYAALRKLARSVHGDEDYEKLCAALDIEAFTDYCAIQLIVGNTDVLNQKVVQSRDGKLPFRPMLFDEDSAYGSKKTDLMYKYFKSAGFTPASSDQILCNNDIYKALYRCPTWRVKFWHRTVELLNTSFSTGTLNGIIDALVEEMEPEMPREIKRYGNHASVTVWKDKVSELRGVIGARKEVIYDQLIHYFGVTSADIRAYERELGVN